MKKNVGIQDQFLRLLVALLIVLLYLGDLISGTIVIIFFPLLAITSLLEYCPLYGLLRISTITKNRRKN